MFQPMSVTADIHEKLTTVFAPVALEIEDQSARHSSHAGATRADGSRFGGVLAYWDAEAVSISSSYPRWRRIGFTGRKIIAIGYATSEMMSDSDLFEGAMREAFAQEVAFALDHSILVGNGAGQPEGVVVSGHPRAVRRLPASRHTSIGGALDSPAHLDPKDAPKHSSAGRR